LSFSDSALSGGLEQIGEAGVADARLDAGSRGCHEPEFDPVRSIGSGPI